MCEEYVGEINNDKMKIVLKDNSYKWIQTGVILIVNFLLWAIPSNIAYLIAQNRDILLGRYSLPRFTWIVLLTPISLMALYLVWSNEFNKRKRQFQIISLTLSVLISLISVDLFMRLTRPKRYIMHRSYYHLPPHEVVRGTFRDMPENAFSYPVLRPGYPDIEYTLTTDKRGFRNETDFDKYDVVVLGDSFAEGSKVTDRDTWASLLARESSLSVCNLGMAGTHPGIYFDTFKKFGVDLSPKLVLCMVYEGNDFRDSNFERKDTLIYRLSLCIRRSPLRLALTDFVIKHLGSERRVDSENPVVLKGDNTGTDGKAPEPVAAKALNWLPLAVPDENSGKFYAFTVKSLLADFQNAETFIRSEGCRKSFTKLSQIKEMCDSKNIQFIIIYAPDKPHVLLPLIQRRVSPENLRAFMALKGHNLPDAEDLISTILLRVGTKECAVEEFCQRQSIGFISLTEPLREGIASGQQLYFTYDDHWTPLGHKIVAKTISQYVNEHLTAKIIGGQETPGFKINENRPEN